MNENIIKDEYQAIIGMLNNRRLIDAFNLMKAFAQNLPNWELSGKIEDMQTSYQYMLDYMKQGVNDPQRDKLYHQLIAKAYQLSNQIRVAKLTPISTSYFFNRKRFYKENPLRTLATIQQELETDIEDLALIKLVDVNRKNNRQYKIRCKHDSDLSELFYIGWLSDIWGDNEEIEAKKLLQSPIIQSTDISILVSAITLNLMEAFDYRKFMFLFDAYQHTSIEIAQRALVGLGLVFLKHDKEISLYPNIETRINLLNEDPRFIKDLNRIQIQLIRCRETEKIYRKMKEEILPGLIKSSQWKDKKEISDELDDENNMNEFNPDWEEWIDKSGLADNLKEISELQMEGVDVFMSTFAQLKHYPFFKEMSNWFYPFDTEQSEVYKSFSSNKKYNNPIFDSIFQSGNFCNSDKYSFYFTITSMPEFQEEIMAQQFQSQNEAMEELRQERGISKNDQMAETTSNQYIQDLYRFFKIFPRRHEFNDPLEKITMFHDLSSLNKILNNYDYLLSLGNYLFYKGYLEEASSTFKKAVMINHNDIEILQKLGFCYQKRKYYNLAINTYLVADILVPNNLWNNKHIATCYKQLGDFEKALEYYNKVNAVQDNNLNTISQIGSCLMSLERYEEALNYYFKLEYYDSESIKTWKALAWCSFIVGKYEQAMKYYDKLLDKETKAEDYMNAGHTALCMGNISKTIKMYKTSLVLNGSFDDFVSTFVKDLYFLLEKGIKKNEISLILDAIRADSLL